MAIEYFNNCCNNNDNGLTNIVWLNREGGYQNYIFRGVKTIEVKGGSGKAYKKDFISKWSSREGVYNGKIVSTSNIEQSHVDYLDSLRYSIQAWEWDDVAATFQEILIAPDDFTKYTTKQKLFDVSIRFIYAHELLIQTQ